MGFAAADVAVGHEILGVFDEVEREQVAPAPVVGETGRAPVIAVEFLSLGEVRLFEQAQAFGLLAAEVLGAEQIGEQTELARCCMLDAACEHLSGQGKVARESHDLLDG